MDGMSPGVVDAGSEATLSPGAAETTTAGIPLATESAASGTEGKAGEPQGSPEIGSATEQETRQRGPSKMDTIRQLRQERREMRQYWESEVGQLKQQLEEFRKMQSTGQPGQQPRKKFFEAPEEYLESELETKLSAMEKRLLDHFGNREIKNQETTEWRQETSEAEKFILNQKGLTQEDVSDIEDIVRETSSMQNLRPMERAKYAWFLWKENHGISDRSANKARASTVSGLPPAAGGLKTWTESEIEAEIKKFPPNPKDYSADDEKRFKTLDNELKRAYREGRVKKT